MDSAGRQSQFTLANKIFLLVELLFLTLYIVGKTFSSWSTETGHIEGSLYYERPSSAMRSNSVFWQFHSSASPLRRFIHPLLHNNCVVYAHKSITPVSKQSCDNTIEGEKSIYLLKVSEVKAQTGAGQTRLT